MKNGSTYWSHFNCRTYYKCDINNKSQPLCCDKGYAYDNQTAKCIHYPYCSLECVEREGTQTTLVPKTPQTFTERMTILVYFYNNINNVGDSFFFPEMHIYNTAEKNTYHSDNGNFIT